MNLCALPWIWWCLYFFAEWENEASWDGSSCELLQVSKVGCQLPLGRFQLNERLYVASLFLFFPCFPLTPTHTSIIVDCTLKMSVVWYRTYTQRLSEQSVGSARLVAIQSGRPVGLWSLTFSLPTPPPLFVPGHQCNNTAATRWRTDAHTQQRSHANSFTGQRRGVVSFQNRRTISGFHYSVIFLKTV
jgi:hypothetical protein